MKIGILTYHRSHNYGAILQAIATRIVLTKMGNEVYYIDYWPSYHRSRYSIISLQQIKTNSHFLFNKRALLYLQYRLRHLFQILKRIRVFNKDINRFITPYTTIQPEYDAILYGSDQIWRKQRELSFYNPVYFGENNYLSPIHFSYAASMGIISDAKEDNEFIRSRLLKFKKIGVREVDLLNYLKRLGVNSYLNLDPTLLVTQSEWDDLLSPKPLVEPGYVLYYSLDKEAFSRAAIERYAAERGLRVVEICGEASSKKKDRYSYASIVDFVSMIKYATIVFSSSYHGLIFSIIYHKDVITSFATNSARALSILEELRMEQRIIKNGLDEIPLLPPIDYNIVESRLGILKEQSIGFLKGCLYN